MLKNRLFKDLFLVLSLLNVLAMLVMMISAPNMISTETSVAYWNATENKTYTSAESGITITEEVQGATTGIFIGILGIFTFMVCVITFSYIMEIFIKFYTMISGKEAKKLKKISDFRPSSGENNG
jgi:hypothetical protein